MPNETVLRLDACMQCDLMKLLPFPPPISRLLNQCQRGYCFSLHICPAQPGTPVQGLMLWEKLAWVLRVEVKWACNDRKAERVHSLPTGNTIGDACDVSGGTAVSTGTHAHTHMHMYTRTRTRTRTRTHARTRTRTHTRTHASERAYRTPTHVTPQ